MRSNTCCTIKLLAFTAATLLTAGCLSISVGTGGGTNVRGHATAPTAFVLKLSGPEGMKFSGSMTADGVVQHLEGGLPYELRLSARTLVCEFKKSGGEGVLTLDITQGDPKSGLSSTVQGNEGVRVDFGETHSVVTGF